MLFTADGKRYHAGAVLFDDDKLVTDAVREQSRKDKTFGLVRAVRVEKDVQHVDCNTRVVEKDKF